MKKSFISAAIALFSWTIFAEPLNVGILNGPSGIPSAYIMENTSHKAAEPQFTFQLFAGADSELPKLLKGEIDVGILPPNAAAKIYQKSNGNVVALAVAGEGNLSLLTTDTNCKGLKDLNGKTITCAGRGATPEYMFRYLLKQNKTEAVLDFSIPNAEIAASLISGKTKYILVPEPFATVALIQGKEKGVRKVTTLSDEYRKIEKTEINFPMTVIVANKKSLATKETQIESYLAAYEEAVTWTNSNPTDAGRLVEKHTLGLMAPIAAASIPNGAYVYKPARAARKEIEKLLNLFLEQDADSIGGKLPDEFFYQK